MVPTNTRASVRLAKAAPAAAEAIAVFIFSKVRSPGEYPGLDSAEQSVLGGLISAGVARGKANEVAIQLLAVGKPRRLLVVGLGAAEVSSPQTYREAGAAVSKAARRQRLGSVAVIPPAHCDGASIAALAEGILVGSFDYGEYYGTAKTSDEKNPASLTATLVVADDAGGKIKSAVERAAIIAHGQNFARTIASRPGNDINPPSLAKVAQHLAREVKISCRVLDEKEMHRLGMGGILAVGAGSANTPPRMIVLEYSGVGAGRAAAKHASGSRKKSSGSQPAPLLVVGKSITFDAGGISIKPADRMGKMIYDKSGGMAVLGLMYAVAHLKLPIRVVGILSSAENILSESAYRPGDILRMYNGVTVEVTNTDAEGRLVLGDALAWGIEQFKPAAVVDLATLTGGVVIALGKTTAGLMSNNDALCDELIAAGRAAGEKIWRLPIWQDHRDLMKSDAADLVNAGPSRDASPLQGGAFLSYFVPWEGKDAIPWAHLDIAGVADTEKELPLYARGSTGWGVRTLVEWVTARSR